MNHQSCYLGCNKPRYGILTLVYNNIYFKINASGFIFSHAFNKSPALTVHRSAQTCFTDMLLYEKDLTSLFYHNINLYVFLLKDCLSPRENS